VARSSQVVMHQQACFLVEERGGGFTVESACLGGDVVKSRGMYATSEKQLVARP